MGRTSGPYVASTAGGALIMAGILLEFAERKRGRIDNWPGVTEVDQGKP